MLNAATIVAAAAVSALGADGARVAFAAGCEVRVWTPPARTSTRVGRMACPRTSTGSGIAAVSIAGKRLLWLHYVGGNIREWSLWTATAAGRSRRLRFVARSVDAPAPIVLGEGDTSRSDDLLVYAVDRDVVALRSSGARRFTWRAPARVSALDTQSSKVAAATGRVVSVLDAGGRTAVTETYPAAVTAVELTGYGLVVQYGRTLELRRMGSVRTFRLPAGARLADADSLRAVYVAGSRVRSVRFDTGRDLGVRAGSLATLESRHLVIVSGRNVSVTHVR